MKKDPKESLNEAFNLFAGDKDFIDFDTLKTIAGVIGEDISDEELADMIKEFDLDQDGKSKIIKSYLLFSFEIM